MIKEVPSCCVEVMLNNIYTGDIPKDLEKLSIGVLQLADMYQLDSLKAACVETLVESLDVESCIPTFIQVDRYLSKQHKAREIVTTFIICKSKAIVETTDWEKLAENYPSLSTELMRAVVRSIDEKHVCQFCILSYT